MPFIISRMNVPISAEQETKLKTLLGLAIELVPGKSEEYLLLGFEDNCRLYLRGDNSRPIAYIEADIFGNEGHMGYEQFTAAVTDIFAETLGIPAENVYVRYADIPSWGAGGMNFGRSRYLR